VPPAPQPGRPQIPQVETVGAVSRETSKCTHKRAANAPLDPRHRPRVSALDALQQGAGGNALAHGHHRCSARSWISVPNAFGPLSICDQVASRCAGS
jgi:hypothetical protein